MFRASCSGIIPARNVNYLTVKYCNHGEFLNTNKKSSNGTVVYCDELPFPRLALGDFGKRRLARGVRTNAVAIAFDINFKSF